MLALRRAVRSLGLNNFGASRYVELSSLLTLYGSFSFASLAGSGETGLSGVAGDVVDSAGRLVVVDDGEAVVLLKVGCGSFVTFVLAGGWFVTPAAGVGCKGVLSAGGATYVCGGAATVVG